VSRVALGRLLLASGDASGALREFDVYLAQGGAIAEEALVGRAVALQRLGRHEEESATWRQVLSRYPGSVNAERARQRLKQP